MSGSGSGSSSGGGDDDRGQAKPEKNPFFDEADVLVPRAKRVKPPPGIISAGGVDMARAHASGIKLRAAVVPEPLVDQPRVVVAVEIDPRKVPTHKRLLEGRDPAGEGTRAAMLPGHGAKPRPSRGKVHGTFSATPASGSAIAGSARPQTPEPEPETAAPAKDPKLPLWTRVALTLTLLLALVGVAQRYRDGDAGPAAQPPPVQPVTPPPAPSTSRPPEAPGTLVEAPRAAAPVAALTQSASAGDAPAANAGVTRRPVKPPPRAAFTPPFQLPGEKN